jgi:uncharacterized membrane protein
MPDAKVACAISGRAHKPHDLTPAGTLRPRLYAMIAADHPELTPNSLISRDVLLPYRARYIEAILEEERGATERLEQSVVARIAGHETIAQDIERLEAEEARSLPLGERIADRVASFGGSWRFIGLFMAVLLAWMALNTLALRQAAFDPYPYILLNLVLSCLAALQAPVIMMSQRRTEARDRARGKNDYLVNLKAELSVRLLHEKVDHLLTQQWQRLAEIQRQQVDIMEELAPARVRRAAARATDGR